MAARASAASGARATSTVPVDGRIQRGDQTRRAILRHAVDVASVEGLEGLSIGRLSADLKISKSGVFAHFGSKLDLQLETIKAARVIFRERVVIPAEAEPPGLLRLWRLTELRLAYLQDRVFPGGCFFINVAAEFDARPGPVRDAIVDGSRAWMRRTIGEVEAAVRLGEIVAAVDAEQLAFELDGMAFAANSRAMLLGGTRPYELARTGMLGRLRAVAADPTRLPPLSAQVSGQVSG